MGNKKSQLQVHVSAGAVQGFRASMEDAHVACALKKHPSVVFCGVFDGHGGRDAAVFAKKHIPVIFDNLLPNSSQGVRDGGLRAIQEAFVVTDFRYFESARSPKSKGTQMLTAGTTASVVALELTSGRLLVANVGDAQSVLSRNGKAIQLTELHKPWKQSERQRIEAAGHTVANGRLDGTLAVSRALGDLRFKPYYAAQIARSLGPGPSAEFWMASALKPPPSGQRSHGGSVSAIISPVMGARTMDFSAGSFTAEMIPSRPPPQSQPRVPRPHSEPVQSLNPPSPLAAAPNLLSPVSPPIAEGNEEEGDEEGELPAGLEEALAESEGSSPGDSDGTPVLAIAVSGPDDSRPGTPDGAGAADGNQSTPLPQRSQSFHEESLSTPKHGSGRTSHLVLPPHSAPPHRSLSMDDADGGNVPRRMASTLADDPSNLRLPPGLPPPGITAGPPSVELCSAWALTALPTVYEWDVDLAAGDEFIVMGCDGLFDVLSPQQVVDWVRRRFSKRKVPQYVRELAAEAKLAPPRTTAATPIEIPADNGEVEVIDPSSYKEFKNLATELCEYAVRCGSKDNVSCIIILIDFPKPDRKTVKAAKKAEKAAAANNGDRGPK